MDVKEIACEGVDLSGVGTGSGAGSCGCSNEHEIRIISWTDNKVLVICKNGPLMMTVSWSRHGVVSETLKTASCSKGGFGHRRGQNPVSAGKVLTN
jgi:hypothetical protein